MTDAAGWGSNFYGQLGNGTTSDSATPVQVSGLTGATAVAGGFGHSLARKSDGTVWAWGSNGSGELGNGTTTSRSTPVQVTGLTGVTAVAAGNYHSLARKTDGTVWAWGNNFYGQLGNGTTTNRSTPVQVQGLTGVTAIAAGDYHSLARKSDGTVWAWGFGGRGQLGNGTRTNSSTPVQVTGLTGVTAVAGGGIHSLARKSDGTVWAWGDNYFGQLGTGTTTGPETCTLPGQGSHPCSTTPVQVTGLTGVTAVAGGGEHSLAVKSDGTLWAWGDNFYGQLGNVTTFRTPTPVQVQGLTGATAVDGGTAHTLARKPDGTVWAWGDNEYGQLGTGTNTGPQSCGGVACSRTPVQVTGLFGAEAVVAGAHHNLAVFRQRAYFPLAPARITDTRPDSARPNAGRTLGPGSVLNVQVSGTGGVPYSGVTAAVLNVTATNPTQQSYLTVWPTGAIRPTASNLNFVPGQTVPNLVEVGLGTDGQVSIYNPAGSVDVVVDVQGYVGGAATTGSGLYKPLVPARITDTRPDSGYPNAGHTLGPGAILNVQVTAAGGVPISGVAAAVLNITATNPTQQSYLTVWPTGAIRPTASNLNFAPDQTVANRVIVRLGTGGQVSIYNPAGSVDVVVDVGGYFTDYSNPSATGAQFTPTTPARITDTRPDSGYPNAGATLGPGGSITVQVTGRGRVPASGVTGAVMNVTATNPTQQSYLTVWPADVPRPFISDLNFISAGQTVPNLVVVKLSSGGAVKVYNAAGSVDVVVDVSGWYSNVP